MMNFSDKAIALLVIWVIVLIVLSVSTQIHIRHIKKNINNEEIVGQEIKHANGFSAMLGIVFTVVIGVMVGMKYMEEKSANQQ